MANATVTRELRRAEHSRISLHRGHVIFRKAYGSRSLQPQKTAMTPEIVFDLASLTKPIATATSILLLAEQGKLKLTDPVKQYVPAFARKETEGITIAQRGTLVESQRKLPAISICLGSFRLQRCRKIRRLERKQYASLSICGSVISQRASRSSSISRNGLPPT